MTDSQQPSANDRYLELQPFVPYPQALRWEIQHAYYERQGLNAWLDGEVPSTITTNSLAAQNNAQLVIDAIRQQEKYNALAPDDSIVVIEYGAGPGLFAFKFLRSFEKLCQRDKLDYAERLVYIASDYAPAVAKALCQQPFLQDDIRAGRLKIASAGITSNPPLTIYEKTHEPNTNPNTQHDEALTTNVEANANINTNIKVTQIPLPLVSAVITNYLHCCLPADAILRQADQWFVKEIKTGVHLTEQEYSAQVSAEDLLASKNLLERLQEAEKWTPIASQALCLDEHHRRALNEVTSDRATSYLTNPTGSLESLSLFYEYLRAGGIYLIHDKGHVNVKAYDRDAFGGQSTHGESTALMTNFPLIQAYAQNLGFQTYLTQSKQYVLHTLLLEKSNQKHHTARFRQCYADFNLNCDLLDLEQYIQIMADAGALEKAVEASLKLIRYRPLDADLYYRLGRLYIGLDRVHPVLNCIQRGRQLDHYQQYNFTLLEAQAHHVLENYTLAIKLYEKAMKAHRKKSEVPCIKKLMADAQSRLDAGLNG